jgi:ribosomal protein S18 acetylase RimI-like enzyme
MVRADMSSSAAVEIRAMRVADIPAGLALCRASGWNQTEKDWRFFLTAARDGALAAVHDGRVVGTVATLPYGPFAWISMVLVDPAVRRKGIGTLLLLRGLALVPTSVTARLDATPSGELLYRKLGFSPEYGVTRRFLDARPHDLARSTNVRPLGDEDWPAIEQLDARAFGAPRIALLKRFAAEAHEYAWVATQNGVLQGFVLGRHGHVRDQLGPLVADSCATADALVDACLSGSRRRGVFLDAPDNQRAWNDALARRNFAIERPLLRMYRGKLTSPGDPSIIFAIAGPEFG